MLALNHRSPKAPFAPSQVILPFKNPLLASSTALPQEPFPVVVIASPREWGREGNTWGEAVCSSLSQASVPPKTAPVPHVAGASSDQRGRGSGRDKAGGGGWGRRLTPELFPGPPSHLQLTLSALSCHSSAPDTKHLLSPHRFLSFYRVSESHLPPSLFWPLHGWIQWCRLQPHLILPRTHVVD